MVYYRLRLSHFYIKKFESHLDRKVMRSLVFFIFLGVFVYLRRQQLAPKLSIGSFGRGQVNREARRIAEAFKGAVRDVVHCECSNVRHIQIMELVFNKHISTKIRMI